MTTPGKPRAMTAARSIFFCLHPVGPETTYGAGPVMCGKPSLTETFPPRCTEHVALAASTRRAGKETK
jgi:hypothetical protein